MDSFVTGMLFIAFFLTGVYTLFIPLFLYDWEHDWKHFKRGLLVLLVLAMVAFVLHLAKMV